MYSNSQEHPRAYVAAAHRQLPDPKDIAAFMEKKVTKHKWLTGGVKIVDEIKKNPVSAARFTSCASSGSSTDNHFNS